MPVFDILFFRRRYLLQCFRHLDFRECGLCLEVFPFHVCYSFRRSGADRTQIGFHATFLPPSAENCSHFDFQSVPRHRLRRLPNEKFPGARASAASLFGLGRWSLVYYWDRTALDSCWLGGGVSWREQVHTKVHPHALAPWWAGGSSSASLLHA